MVFVLLNGNKLGFFRRFVIQELLQPAGNPYF
jgi:hypothetical protein